MLCMDEFEIVSMAYFDSRRKNNVWQCSFLEYNTWPTNKVLVGTLIHIGGTCYIDMRPQNPALHVISDANLSPKSCAWEVGYELVKCWDVATHPSQVLIKPTTNTLVSQRYSREGISALQGSRKNDSLRTDFGWVNHPYKLGPSKGQPHTIC